MIRLLAALAVLTLLSACGAGDPPESRDSRIDLSGFWRSS